MKKKSINDNSRSNSLNVKPMKRNDRVQENKILIYREIGFSRSKIINLFKNYLNFVKHHIHKFNPYELQEQNKQNNNNHHNNNHHNNNNKFKLANNNHNNNHKDNNHKDN